MAGRYDPSDFIKKTENRLKQISKRIEGALSSPSEEAPKPAAPRRQTAAGRAAPDQERVALLKFFVTHPKLAEARGLKENLYNTSKKDLLEAARLCYLENQQARKRHDDRNQWIDTLHADMVSPTGLLGILNAMMKDAQDKDTVSWETYRSYALSRLQALKEPKGDTPWTGEAIPENVAELLQGIRDQEKQLTARQEETVYEPLFDHIRTIPLDANLGEDELEEWYKQTMVILKQGMGELSERLQTTLKDRYPHLFP